MEEDVRWQMYEVRCMDQETRWQKMYDGGWKMDDVWKSSESVEV